MRALSLGLLCPGLLGLGVHAPFRPPVGASWHAALRTWHGSSRSSQGTGSAGAAAAIASTPRSVRKREARGPAAEAHPPPWARLPPRLPWATLPWAPRPWAPPPWARLPPRLTTWFLRRCEGRATDSALGSSASALGSPASSSALGDSALGSSALGSSALGSSASSSDDVVSSPM